MGSTTSRCLTDSEVSAALAVLGDANAPLPSKASAFDVLRAHFVPSLSPQEKLAAVAAVSRERYTPWDDSPIPAGASTLSGEELADKVRGLIFGAALGDATGLATEFLNRTQVEGFYGEGFAFSPRPSRLYPDTHRMMWTPGDWTDDTDQLVLVLQSLLHTRGRVDPADFSSRLGAWCRGGFACLGDTSAAGLGRHTKSVISHSRFAEDPHTAALDIWERGGRASAANGAVMRTAVSGVPCFWSIPTVVSNTTELCRTTHADPRCIASCVVVAVCVSEMLRGALTHGPDDVDAVIATAIGAASEVLGDAHPAREELQALAKATVAEPEADALRALHLDDPHSLGYTYKCLGAGLWAFRSQAGSFEAGVRAIVAEGGDADTNGAVAGALLGCRLGFSRLPGAWVAQLAHGAWLEAHAQKLLIMLHGRAAVRCDDVLES
mmetsp:Transcript_20602/g.53242  ORF Transcript_20602/g.53242 Transcript_20602/m.53242 type:complete len:437 (-) Transcript_20602:139-1449(-)